MRAPGGRPGGRRREAAAAPQRLCTELDDSRHSSRNVCVAGGVVAQIIPLKVRDRDNGEAALAKKAVPQQRRAARLRSAARRRGINPAEEVRRTVKLHGDESAAREAHQRVDQVEPVENRRLLLHSEAGAGEGRGNVALGP